MSFYFVLCSFVQEATICQSVSSHVKRVLSEYRKYACLLEKKMVDLMCAFFVDLVENTSGGFVLL